LDLAGVLGRGDHGEQRQPPGDREAADVGADIHISLQGDVQGRSRVVDRTADQRLHRGIAAASINELHVEAAILEITVAARDLIWHSAQKLAAVSELDLPGLCVCTAGRRRGNYSCGQARAPEQRAPGEIGARHAGDRFIAAAHRNLIGRRIVAMPQA